MAIKTEHAGAKNGGGYWGRRVVAKEISNHLRRQDDKLEASITKPQYLYRPVDGGGFIIESVVYGDVVCGRMREHVNFVGLAATEDDARRIIAVVVTPVT